MEESIYTRISLIWLLRFVDGNKRTALLSTGVFLGLNGWKLKNTREEEVEFVVKVDNSNLNIEQISAWLKENSQKV